MRRVTREDLRTDIWIVLTVLKPFQKRALGLDIPRIREDVADTIVNRVLGAPGPSEAVLIQPSIVGGVLNERRGRWGEDEPHPCPDPPPPPPPTR